MTPSPSRLLAELLRIHLGRHDQPCDEEALRELLGAPGRAPALVRLGAMQQPTVTDVGRELIGELVTTWSVMV